VQNFDVTCLLVFLDVQKYGFINFIINLRLNNSRFYVVN
jgi:hypothetical protein